MLYSHGYILCSYTHSCYGLESHQPHTEHKTTGDGRAKSFFLFLDWPGSNPGPADAVAVY